MSRFLTRLPLMATLLALFFLITACSPPQKPTSKADPEASGKSKSPYAGMEPQTDRENPPGSLPRKSLTSRDREALTPFGEAYARAVSEGDSPAAAAAWNMNAMLDIAFGDISEKEPKIVEGIKRGALTSLEKKPGGILWASFGNPCRMLRVHEVDGETRILCRITAEEGVIYLDLIPEINDSGEPEIVDVYAFGAGEKISKTFRRLILPQVAELAKTPIERLLTTPDPLAKNLSQFRALSQAVQSGEYEQAIEIFRALPPEVQENKAVLLIYMGAASKWMTADENPDAEKSYRDGVTRFQQLFGDDPAFLLLGIDYYFYEEDFDAAAEAIDKLDKAVGGDPYLDFFRASVMLSQEKYAEALPLARKALENDPDIEDPYWGVVNIQLALGNFEEVAAALDQLVDRFDYEFELKDDPAYDEFRLSPTGKAWIEKHQSQ